jgi:FAD/FMN-containing dehydrogenase
VTDDSEASTRVVTPADVGYEQACQVWNSIYTASPAEIVYCSAATDVSAALGRALDKGTPFRLRCGGHSYEGYSTLDDGVIIDVTDMNRVTVSDDRKTAVIGAGGRLGDIYSALSAEGVAIPGGTCPPVGISGLTLGGGLGMLVRAEGMLIDSLLSLEMVDARGRVLTADRDNHPDLFWACRGGGGGNFGIATSFTFGLVPVKVATVFTVTWPWDDFEEAMGAWERWASVADERISMLFVPLPESAGVVTVLGEFRGTKDELTPLLDPISKVGQPTVESNEYTSYIDAVNQVATLEGPQATAATSRVKGKTSFVSDPLGPEAIRTFKDWMAQAPDGAAPTIYAMGGAISRVRPEETAFVHRDARFLIAYQTNWDSADDDRTNLDWCENIYEAMRPYVKGGAYVNIPDRTLTDWLRAYYGDNLRRLVEVKRAYDPEDVFHFAQSIPLSLHGDATEVKEEKNV